MTKQINIFMLLGFFLINLTACSAPKAKFVVEVLNSETELPIEEAEVKFRYTEVRAKPAGMGWGNLSKTNSTIKVTDQSGYVTDEGRISWMKQMGISISKGGYYSSGIGKDGAKKKNSMTKNKLLNRWEPWPCELTIKLRPIKDPVPMYVKSIETSIPEKNKPIGFDLEVGDWVSPYGKGKVRDFIIKIKEGEEGKKIKLDTFDIAFSNKLDGIQEFKGIKGNQSTFGFPYLAPGGGYLESYQFHRKWHKTELYGYQFQGDNMNDKTFFFRTRTKTDNNGNIIFAKYGIITGVEFSIYKDKFKNFRLTYKLNPDNKSRSLEYNRKNLFKDRDESGRLR